jgi:hypothetical protein
MSNSVAWLFFNTDAEDKKAVDEILDSGIPCRLRGALAEERTPLLVYDSAVWRGLSGVREFIREHKNELIRSA